MVVAYACSHCYHRGYLAGYLVQLPCKPYSKNGAECVNQDETKYCSYNPSDYDKCYSTGTLILHNSVYTLQLIWRNFNFNNQEILSMFWIYNLVDCRDTARSDYSCAYWINYYEDGCHHYSNQRYCKKSCNLCKNGV